MKTSKATGDASPDVSQTKLDLQNKDAEIDALEKQLNQFNLAKDGDKDAVRIRQDQLTTELMGGQVSDQTISSIASGIAFHSVKTESYAGAIALTTGQLATARAEREALAYKLACEDYEARAAEARKTLMICFGSLFDVDAALRKIPTLAPPVGYRPSASAMLTKNMIGQLAEKDLLRWLLEMQRIAPDFMHDAKKESKLGR